MKADAAAVVALGFAVAEFRGTTVRGRRLLDPPNMFVDVTWAGAGSGPKERCDSDVTKPAWIKLLGRLDNHR